MGRVLHVWPKKERVLVEGINNVKRHTRPNPNNQQGGIVEKEAPLHVSNLMIIDSQTDERTRIRIQRLEDGRVCGLLKKVVSKFQKLNNEDDMATRLQEYYENEVVPALIQRFGYKNRMQVPKLEKVVLNMGVGEAVLNAKVIENAVEDLTRIAGQRPSIRRARKAVSNFKLRQGVPIGCAVTLRRSRMYEFLDRFFNFSVPRIRDFRGLSMRSFDGRGNYTIGIQEQIIFLKSTMIKSTKFAASM